MIIIYVQVKNTALYRQSDKFLLALLSIDYKFLLVPLAFIILRFWSFLGDVLHLYAGMRRLNTGLSFALVILGVSVHELADRNECFTFI